MSLRVDPQPTELTWSPALQTAPSVQATSQLTVQAELQALRATNARQQEEIQNHILAVQQAEQAVCKANERVKEVEEDLRTAETIRRKLHNQVQELKGKSNGIG